MPSEDESRAVQSHRRELLGSRLMLSTRSRVAGALNGVLRPLNLRVNSLTTQRAEERKSRALARAGYFDAPAFPVLNCFRNSDGSPLIDAVPCFSDRWTDLSVAERNKVGYSFDNGWFGSPDAEVAYAVVQRYRPNCIVEVGCGNSTKLLRQSIIDARLDTRLICVDPQPRADVREFATHIFEQEVQTLECSELLSWLGPRDVLFIDSSHVAAQGSDVIYLLLNVLPRLRPDVLVHLHDIFLPYDYPPDVVAELRWSEQYLVQALLASTDQYELLWAGHYIQRLRPDLHASLDLYAPERRASSLWLRKGG
jgi:Methyltransferase domain